MKCSLDTNVTCAATFAQMMPETEHYTTQFFSCEEDWRIGRSQFMLDGKRVVTIGGSDAPVVAGVSSFKTRDELAAELRGDVEPEDLSQNPNVIRGKESEPFVRALFAVEHPQYNVYDGTHIVFHSKQYPWMSASLDGILIERETGKIYILELKSCLWSRNWSGDYAPDNYFVQVMHQLAVTHFDGVYLHPRIIGMKATTERDYFFTYKQCEEQMAALIEDERKFVEALKNGEQVSAKIPTIV